MAEPDLRLKTLEMARFAARGFLKFESLVPEELNRRFLEEMRENGQPEASPAGTPLAAAYPDSTLRDILALPRVAAIIQSLVGSTPLFDHQGTHFAAPAAKFEAAGVRVASQHYHQDSTIDPRRAFDIQLMYYPHQVTRAMGGTRFLPGSHLRVVSEMAIGRYQNIVGQKQVVCPAGTLLVLHHGIWHGGSVNRSEQTRYMLKVRLNPTEPQHRLWNTEDLRPEMSDPQVIFDFRKFGKPDLEDLQTVLCHPEPWFEADTGRLEFINRIRLWRYLLGEEDFDAHHWCRRIENLADA